MHVIEIMRGITLEREETWVIAAPAGVAARSLLQDFTAYFLSRSQ